MKTFIKLISILTFVCSWGCHLGPQKVKSGSATASNNFKPYYLRAGGPQSVTLITNAPESNRVSISLVTGTDENPVFRLANGEGHTILLWNVRVQVRSEGSGTDGFGWDTVSDDYPDGQAKFSPGESGTFRVQNPREIPWRVCIIYSTDWADSGNSASGNYEVISQLLSR